MSAQDGGPAFPHIADVVERLPDGGIMMRQLTEGGMALRQWYKGQAIAAMATDHGDPCDGYREAVSKRAAALADAMLAEDAAFAERAKGGAK